MRPAMAPAETAGEVRPAEAALPEPGRPPEEAPPEEVGLPEGTAARAVCPERTDPEADREATDT